MSYRPYLPGVLAGEPVTTEVEYVEIMSVFHPSESWGGVTQIDKIHFYFHFMYIDALIRDATCLPTHGFGGAKVIVNLVIVKRWAGKLQAGQKSLVSLNYSQNRIFRFESGRNLLECQGQEVNQATGSLQI